MYKLKSTQQPYFLGLESIRHGTEPLGLILRALWTYNIAIQPRIFLLYEVKITYDGAWDMEQI